MKVEVAVLGSPSIIVFVVSVEVKAPRKKKELCERRGGRPWLPSLLSLIVSVDVKQHESRSCVKVEVVPNSLCGLYGRKHQERRRNCVKVDVAVLDSPSLIVM